MSAPAETGETVLIVDDDVLVRTAIAAYLRDCGYHVIEAAHAGETQTILSDDTFSIAAVLSAVELQGPMDGFALSRWIRENRPGVDVILAGTPRRAAREAADLCEEGPTLTRPYDPQVVVEQLRRRGAVRKSP